MHILRTKMIFIKMCEGSQLCIYIYLYANIDEKICMNIYVIVTMSSFLQDRNQNMYMLQQFAPECTKNQQILNRCVYLYKYIYVNTYASIQIDKDIFKSLYIGSKHVHVGVLCIRVQQKPAGGAFFYRCICKNVLV